MDFRKRICEITLRCRAENPSALPVHSRCSPVERGQSLMEMAVSLVVLLVILAGIVDLGRMFFTYIGMRDAAQEGIVYAITEPAECAEIENRIVALLTDDSGIQISIVMNGVECSLADAQDACSGNTVEVIVVDPDFALSMPFLGAFLGRQSIRLEAGVTGTILRPSCQ